MISINNEFAEGLKKLMHDGWSWHSCIGDRSVIKKYCPDLNEQGNPVVCYPTPYWPLGVKVSFSPIQEGTGDPSPENIRPIVGRDAVQVTRCGESLLDLTNAVQRGYNREPIPNLMSPGQTYTYRVDDGGDNRYAFFGFVSADRNIQVGLTPYLETGAHKTFTAPANIRQFDTLALAGSTPDAGPYAAKASLVVGPFAPTGYKPYQATTITLTFPRTIYGGEVDCQTGEGIETWKMLTLDGTENWGIGGGFLPDKSDSYYILNTKISDAVDETPDEANQVCSHYPYGNVTNNRTAKGCAIVWGHIRFRFEGMSLDSVTEWKTYLAIQVAAGTPVTVAYKLAEPFNTFQATGGAPLTVLDGTNTILTDGDTMTVTGKSDPIKVIETLNRKLSEPMTLEYLQNDEDGRVDPTEPPPEIPEDTQLTE